MLPCVAVCCGVLRCVAVCCRVLQCVALCCRVLPCVAVCCIRPKGCCVFNISCSHLHILHLITTFNCCRVLPYVAVCCYVLQCVAVCCSVVLQCVINIKVRIEHTISNLNIHHLIRFIFVMCVSSQKTKKIQKKVSPIILRGDGFSSTSR